MHEKIQKHYLLQHDTTKTKQFFPSPERERRAGLTA
jgi:hypothetical protein